MVSILVIHTVFHTGYKLCGAIFITKYIFVAMTLFSVLFSSSYYYYYSAFLFSMSFHVFIVFMHPVQNETVGELHFVNLTFILVDSGCDHG